MKIPVFILIFLIYLSANYYVFHRIWLAMPSTTALRVLLVAVAVITISSFFIVFSFGESLPIGLTTVLYAVGTSWLFILIYFILVFLFQDLILLANKVFNFIPTTMVTQFSKDNWVGLLFTMIFIAFVMVSGYLKYSWKQRVELPIQFSKVMGDSISPRSLKAVAISDLHLGYTIGEKELEKWVALINKENPDIVFIAGDIIDNSMRPIENTNIARIIKSIDAPLGIYACLGNHEYIANQKKSISFYKEAGIKLLKDEYAEVDSAFYVVGRDDKTNGNRKSLDEILVGVDKSKPIILLDHQPYDLHVAEENGVDLQISGHTHKGQLWPISLITRMIYEIDHGYLKKGDTHIYVSSGIGIWGGKFRIGTQSEFVVIDINK